MKKKLTRRGMVCKYIHSLKLTKTMRISVLFMFVGTLHIMAGNSYSQSAKLSLDFQQVTVEYVLGQIENQSEFFFLYNNKLVDVERQVDLTVDNTKIGDILDHLFKDADVDYVVLDRQIVLSPSKYLTETKAKLQPGTVNGKVTDSRGEPLVGVTVIQKGTSNGAVTDNNGKYTISEVPDNAILVFSYVGMKTEEVPIGDRSEVNLVMTEEVVGLDEVVAIGYGTLSKRNISGSITNVKEGEFNKGVTQSAADLLQGRVAGLTITTEGGDVTAGQTMRLRGTSSLTGSSSPFVVIDGVPGMDINSVSPQDIESISILKDASAVAIYGSRSASGVILITTKKGKAGKTSVNYSNYFALETVASKPDLLTASQWREATSGMDVAGLDLGANTDWFDEIMRTGFSQNHNLSVSGGLEGGNYRISVNYLDREGIMKDNELERFNTLFSLNKKVLNDKLDISISAGSVLSNFTPTNSYNTVLAYNMLPVYPVKNDDGSWFTIQEWDQGNPVANIEENSNLNQTSLLFGNVKAELEIVKGLKAGVNLFKQRSASDQSIYNSSITQAGRQDQGYAYRGNQLWNKELLELTLGYAADFGIHNLNILGGYSYEDNDYQSVRSSNRTFISDMFEYNNLAAGENLFPADVGSYKSMNRLISFFGRLNYTIAGKYIVTATIRQDGSSKFGDNHKWGTFPSISGAWRISDEEFMSNASFINDLKIRIGYGIVGNQDGIGSYNSLALYGRGDEYFENGVWRNTYKYSQNHNPDLKWEETASFNPGIDFALFNSRLYGSIDYYDKKTTDLLYVYNVPVPPNLYPTMLANVGDMSNKGIEIILNGDIVRSGDFKWSATVNFAHNKNVIERLSDDIYQTDNIKTGGISLRGSGYLTSHIIEEGQEVGTFYNLRSSGLDENGKFLIDDLNEDGMINNLDYTYIGHAMPRFTYGILNTFTYKKFDLSIFMRGLYGNDVLDSPRVQYSNPKWLPGGNVLAEVLTNGITDDPLFSSYFIYDGSFLRMENMSLSYDIGALNKIGIGSLRIFATAQNLFIITKFEGIDPEVRMSGLDPGKLEHYFVPKPKTFTIGLDVRF
ncbi:MAG: TonB-dependent receptor [Bacteroidota bacterium]